MNFSHSQHLVTFPSCLFCMIRFVVSLLSPLLPFLGHYFCWIFYTFVHIFLIFFLSYILCSMFLYAFIHFCFFISLPTHLVPFIVFIYFSLVSIFWIAFSQTVHLPCVYPAIINLPVFITFMWHILTSHFSLSFPAVLYGLYLCYSLTPSPGFLSQLVAKPSSIWGM